MQGAYVDEDNKSDWVVARVFDTKVDIVEQFGFAKEYEFKASKLFSEIGVGPPVLGIFKNGLVIGFVHGTLYGWAELTPFRDNMKLLE
jgi:hypothetical protein